MTADDTAASRQIALVGDQSPPARLPRRDRDVSTADQPDVRPGQLWIDNDKRNRATRFVRVSAIEGDKAVCEAWYDEAGSLSRTVQIRLDRFRPIATGYRLHSTPSPPVEGNTTPEVKG